MWAVMKVRKLVILHGRPKTNFVWLGVTKLAFTRPLLENSHSLSFLYSRKMWMGLKGVASNWHCLKENDVDCPGECTEMDAKQCTAFELCFSSSKQLVGFFRKYSDNINISDCCLFRSCYYSCYANAINNQYKELYPRMMIDSTGKTRAAKGFEAFILTFAILCKPTKLYKNVMKAGL